MACKKVISDLEKWMDKAGYPDIESLRGDALKLFNMPDDFAKARQNKLGDAYQFAQVDQDKCIQRCPGHAITLENGKDHHQCLQYQKTIMPRLLPRFGCGLCQTDVPCEHTKPLG